MSMTEPAPGHNAVETRREKSAVAPQPKAVAPRAMYRLQFHHGFTFRDAERLVPYLSTLGVSHLYASPVFRANPGSMHGYDIVDYGELNPELGTAADFASLSDALKRHDMGLMLDFVPNHMGIASGRNRWWQDVLENGQASEFAPFFDIDWQPLKPELENQVLLPLLGDHYGVVLENGEFRLRYEQGAFTLWYYELPLPIAPPTYPKVLNRLLPALSEALPLDDHDLLEFQSIAAAFERLEPSSSAGEESIAERTREQVVTKIRLANLIEKNAQVRGLLEQTLAELNGHRGEPHSFDRLDDLILAQSFRLSFWRVAAEEINYRRFFAINELVAIRQEHRPVFDMSHDLLLHLIAEGRVDSVRIDHPDGLWDPAAYFRDLQRSAFRAIAGAQLEVDEIESAEVGANAMTNTTVARPIALYVEKIIEREEPLPLDWMVDGTVGYEFAQSVGGLFVDAKNRKTFDDLYSTFTSESTRFDDIVYEKKKLIMRVALASEVNVLARALDRLSEQHRRTRDFTYNGLRYAMREVIACFPVYRTYITEESGGVSDRDRPYIERAIREAVKRNPASDPDVFRFLRDILLLNISDELTATQRAEHVRFVMKFQQLTGPVMAKGLEDTAFFTYLRLLSLNEVGGDPAAFGVSVDEFHRRNSARRRHWPRALLASSTHDTKRSEDVRARISALSELPKPWRQALNRWARMNRRHKAKISGQAAPDRNDEYHLYQVLLGAWPLGLDRPDQEFIGRVEAYMLKAIHEAQVHSSWINPNQEYDEAMSAFVRNVLAAENETFLVDFSHLRERIALTGAFNALSQQLLKLTSPGVPDIYQGTELWDFSLVDPDNRRAIDFNSRAKMLTLLKRRAVSAKLACELTDQWRDGRVKLYLTQRALTFRAGHRELFTDGDYVPLSASGAKAAHIVAFARTLGEWQAIVVAPRLVGGLIGAEPVPPIGEVWGDTALNITGSSTATFRCIFSGAIHSVHATEALPVSQVLEAFPVALLERVS